MLANKLADSDKLRPEIGDMRCAFDNPAATYASSIRWRFFLFAGASGEKERGNKNCQAGPILHVNLPLR